ncbi:MAG: deoxynucleoside kinase [Pseudomonadota bacterium]
MATELRYLAVEGPIGVGKSTLARALAERLGGELVLEEPHANPFLERFYREPRTAALPTQLTFLLQRSRQAQQLRQADMFAPVRVADFMLDKDRLFARLTLDDDEYSLYEQLYERLAMDAPVPDLVIYLQAGPDVLLERIARRGIACEQRIERRYLERLGDAYSRYFHFYDAGALLIINNERLDVQAREEDLQAVLEAIGRIRHGRHYLNSGQPSLFRSR